MTSPEHQETVISERLALEADIRKAFKGITRDGGVSWSETKVIDDYGAREDNPARARARVGDTDQAWEQLVDDPNWDDPRGTGGFTFLDAIGFRYYIAPAMLRCLKRGKSEWLADSLTLDARCQLDKLGLLSESQMKAIARFIQFMIAKCDVEGEDGWRDAWQAAYESHWRSVDR